MRALASVVLAWWTAGCAAAGPDMAFDSQDDTAFVLVVVEAAAMPADLNSIFRFRRVDLDSRSNGRGAFDANFQSPGVLGGQELVPSEGAASGYRFAGVEVPAGDYALLSRRDLAVRSTFTRCYAHQAPVYRLEEGVINILEAPGVRRIGVEVIGAVSSPATDEDVRRVLAEYAEAQDEALFAAGERGLSSYSNMTADRRVVRPLGLAIYGTLEEVMRDRSCYARRRFEFQPLE